MSRSPSVLAALACSSGPTLTLTEAGVAKAAVTLARTAAVARIRVRMVISRISPSHLR